MAAAPRSRPLPGGRPGIAERDLAALGPVAPAQFSGAKMAMEMRLPVARKPLSESLGRETKKHLVVPGDTITTDTGFMRCVGTWGPGATKGGCWALHVARWPQPGPLSPVMKRPRDPERISRASPLYTALGCCSLHPVCPRVRLSQRPLGPFSPGLCWPWILVPRPEAQFSEPSSPETWKTGRVRSRGLLVGQRTPDLASSPSQVHHFGISTCLG